MFDTTSNKKLEVIKCNDAIKSLHKERNDLLYSKRYVFGTKIDKLKKQGVIKLIKNRIEMYIDDKKRDLKTLDKRYKLLDNATNNRNDTNYFFNERIAVYTCITGGYDKLIEPLVKPDNIDYYAVTDFDIPKDSLWKRMDIDSISEIKDLSNTLKNRYVKMNPHKIFTDYNYSVYVDGNIKIYTDFTEHINRISKYGFAHFKHSRRKSSYEEADACKLLRKVDDDSIDKYVKKLKEENFPDNYGMLECSILARKHSNENCVNIMEQWWEEFKNNVKRDQIILPYILYKNNIKVDDVATLGSNIDEELSFEVIKHKGKE